MNGLPRLTSYKNTVDATVQLVCDFVPVMKSGCDVHVNTIHNFAIALNQLKNFFRSRQFWKRTYHYFLYIGSGLQLDQAKQSAFKEK